MVGPVGGDDWVRGVVLLKGLVVFCQSDAMEPEKGEIREGGRCKK